MGSIFQEACIGLDYVELPDLSLPALQKRFTIPSELEELYKRYEQRFQVGKSVSPLPPQLRISLVFHVDSVAARMPWLGWEWASCWGRFQLVPISMLYYYIFFFWCRDLLSIPDVSSSGMRYRYRLVSPRLQGKGKMNDLWGRQNVMVG